MNAVVRPPWQARELLVLRGGWSSATKGHVHWCLHTEFNKEAGTWGKGMFEMFNLDWKVGGTMKIKGHISEDADRFAINLGCKSSDLALHFNPRFNESVIVCNSLCSDNWQQEQRDKHFSFHKGSTVKIIIEFLGDKFLVKLPDGHEVEFPNRHGYDKISYLNIHGGFKVTSFKVE